MLRVDCGHAHVNTHIYQDILDLDKLILHKDCEQDRTLQDPGLRERWHLPLSTCHVSLLALVTCLCQRTQQNHCLLRFIMQPSPRSQGQGHRVKAKLWPHKVAILLPRTTHWQIRKAANYVMKHTFI